MDDIPGVTCNQEAVPDCEGAECECRAGVGGPGVGFDPVNLVGGGTVFDRKDASVRGLFGELAFTRRFVTSSRPWLYAYTLGRPGEAFLPKPFGSSPSSAESLNWWHTLYSFVFPEGFRPSASRWMVRNENGALIEFEACSSGADACFARPTVKSGETTAQLYWTGGGLEAGHFIFFSEGKRYVYDAIWNPPGLGQRRYFLGYVEDGQYPASGAAPRRVVSLSYASPLDGACPGADAVGSGVPYLQAAWTSEGAELRFRYRKLPGASGLMECVLDSVSVMDRPLGGVPQEKVLAQYAYEWVNGSERAGRLREVMWPQSGRQEAYGYTSGFSTHVEGTVTSNHVEDSQNRVGSAVSTGENVTFAWNSAVACDNASCVRAFQNEAADRDIRTGSIYYNPLNDYALLVHRYVVQQTSFALSPRVREYEQTCHAQAPYNCYAFPGGKRAWEWASSPDGGQPILKAEKDMRGGYTAYAYASPPSVDAGVRLPLELSSVARGAADADGGSALARDTFRYQYGGEGQTPRAFEPLVTREERPSVFSTSTTAKAAIHNVYDTATNRLKATMRVGWTKTYNASSGWNTTKRYLATFYFTRRVCSGEASDDALGRVVEVHGPCWAASETATDCSTTLNPGGKFPITQYTYWPDTESSNRRGRLQSVTRYPSAGTTCAGGLATRFEQYDAQGNPTEVVDPNGVVTQLAYVDGEVTSMSKGGLTTRFGYENGKLVYLQHPEGNYEVFC